MDALRSGQSVNNQWRTVNDVADHGQFRGHESIDTRTRLAASARDLRLDPGGDLYPFKIYCYPTVWRATSAPTTDWLKFRVSLGYYNNVVVSGCDRTDALPGAGNYVPGGPDSQTIPSESGSDFTGTEYTIATGQSQIYFWIDATTPTSPLIKYGYTGMTVSGNGGDPVSLGWTAFPTPDAQHIPIGWVDTNTDSTTYTAHIRQILRHDNPAAGGGGGNGQLTMYDQTGGTAYSNGAEVGVASQFTLSGVTVLPGTYRLIGTLSTPMSPTGNQIPQIPVPPSGTIYWWPVAAGLVTASSCTSGTTTQIYINSTGMI